MDIVLIQNLIRIKLSAIVNGIRWKMIYSYIDYVLCFYKAKINTISEDTIRIVERKQSYFKN